MADVPSQTPFSELVQELVNKMQEPLGLDRWEIHTSIGKVIAAEEKPVLPSAGCSASPEYRQAQVVFDPDQFLTGNDLGEVVAHELAHALIWPVHAVAEENAHLVADSAPEYMKEGLRAKLIEDVRKAAETTTTDVGHVFIKLLRRLWDTENALEAARTAPRKRTKRTQR